jgi:hypothetical protein
MFRSTVDKAKKEPLQKKRLGSQQGGVKQSGMGPLQIQIAGSEAMMRAYA